MIYTSTTRRTRHYCFSFFFFFSYVKQNFSSTGSLNRDFQKQKQKYRASLAKTIKTGSTGAGLTASTLSLACPHTFRGSQLFHKCQVMKVRESQKFLTANPKSEIFNTRASGAVAKECELIWGGNKKKGKENGGIEVWREGIRCWKGLGHKQEEAEKVQRVKKPIRRV